MSLLHGRSVAPSLLAVMLALVAGCASSSKIKPTQDYTRGTDFRPYRTFVFLSPTEMGAWYGGKPHDAEVSSYVENAVGRELVARGLRPVDASQADLAIAFRAGKHQDVDEATYGRTYAVDPTTGNATAVPIKKDIIEGSLVIDLHRRAHPEARLARVGRGEAGTRDDRLRRGRHPGAVPARSLRGAPTGTGPAGTGSAPAARERLIRPRKEGTMPGFALKKLTKATYDDVLARIPDLLKEEGFGVLTRIDVKETMKQKIGVEFRRYQILGACNPQIAHKVLSADSRGRNHAALQRRRVRGRRRSRGGAGRRPRADGRCRQPGREVLRGRRGDAAPARAGEDSSLRRRAARRRSRPRWAAAFGADASRRVTSAVASAWR